MPKNNESLNKELYDLLLSRGYNPVGKDADVKNIEKTVPPQEADVFLFNFKKDGKNYGQLAATIDNSRQLVLYNHDDVTKSPESNTSGTEFSDSFRSLQRHLKNWALTHQLDWEPKNMDKLSYDMAQRTYMKKKEQIAEGYYPMGKSASYNDNIPTVKIILQHTRQIQEGEQRFRHIAKIFLENTQGERILAPTVKPGIAQVYARHLAEGGVPNDERWNHIKSLCEEYTKMAGFVRAVRNNQFNESAQRLVEAGLNHYVGLRETLGKMRGHRGYNSYFESWTPTLMETEGDESNLNELFVQETLDPRIESVMPILNRLKVNLGEMKEVGELSEWADNLLEGGDGGEASEEPVEPLEEAPGAETLAHNQKVADQRMKALDLEENVLDESWFVDTLKKVGKSVLDRLAPNDKMLLLQLQKDMGIPPSSQHGMTGMAIPDEDLDTFIAAARTKAKELSRTPNSVSRNFAQGGKDLGIFKEEEVEESGLQAYLGNKKYGKEGMDALRKAGREHASKEKMASIRAKYDKLDEEGMGGEQSTDANYEIVDRRTMQPVFRFIANTETEAHRKYEDWLSAQSLPDTTENYGFRAVARSESDYDARMRRLAAGYHGMNPQRRARMEKIPGWKDQYVQALDYVKKHPKKDEQGVAEDLDANQKRVGQLGPTEKVGPKGAVGKLVGANESVELSEMDKSQPSSDRGGESSGDPYAKGGKATPIKADKAKKDFLGVLQKSVDKHNKAKQDTDKKVTQHMKEGQDDLEALLRLIK